MSDIILETTDVKKHFPVRRGFFAKPDLVRAVDGVSLRVRRGETLAIVGESGCGKSTLARLMIRLIDPTEGHVLFEDCPTDSLAGPELRAFRRDVQFVFQDPFSSLNPRMSVGALLAEPMRAHGIGTGDRRAEVADLLARVGLRPEYADRYPHEFSGGQRQRIGIARALATRPKLLIGDEPVSALDISVQAQVINLLEELKDAFGLTLVVIAHDLGVVRHMADRVGVMYLGELVELAPAAAYFARPMHPYSHALLGALPAPHPTARHLTAAAAVPGDLPSPIAPPPGCRFHPRCPHARDRCRAERPALRPMPDGRGTACHFAETLGPGPALPAAPARTPAAERRFALYRAAQARATARPDRRPTRAV
jgi:oligopeptide/dipeptide ABC transporter ATP-binding protein